MHETPHKAHPGWRQERVGPHFDPEGTCSYPDSSFSGVDLTSLLNGPVTEKFLPTRALRVCSYRPFRTSQRVAREVPSRLELHDDDSLRNAECAQRLRHQYEAGVREHNL